MAVGRRTSIESPSADEESVEDAAVSHAPIASVEEPDTEPGEHPPVEEPEHPRAAPESPKAQSKKPARKPSKTAWTSDTILESLDRRTIVLNPIHDKASTDSTLKFFLLTFALTWPFFSFCFPLHRHALKT